MTMIVHGNKSKVVDKFGPWEQYGTLQLEAANIMRLSCADILLMS